MIAPILQGKWLYRSLYNNQDPTTAFNDLKFGQGTIEIMEAPMQQLVGTIGGDDWQLNLKGSITYGNPFELRFQGVGVVSGAEWIYDYHGYLMKDWPNGVHQVPAIVGTIVRTIPHPTGPNGESTAPAGFVASWYAVKL